MRISRIVRSPDWLKASFNAINDQANFVTMSGTALLPIDLFMFNGKKEGNVNNLYWSTASEQNNDYFTLERAKEEAGGSSQAGLEWEIIGKVKSKAPGGSSSTKLKYDFTDNQINSQFPIPNSQIFYYRLKQTDFDGHYKYSNTIAIEEARKKDLQFYVFPNPAKSTINIRLQGNTGDRVLVVLYDILGNEYYSKAVSLENAESLIVINKNENLPTGVYFITASSNNKIYRRKLIVQ